MCLMLDKDLLKINCYNPAADKLTIFFKLINHFF
jgi:hypothetical protein